MTRLLRTPQTSDRATASATVQDLCGLLVVIGLIAIAALALP